MKLLIQLSQSIQSADGTSYSAVYGECEQSDIMGVTAGKFIGAYADLAIPLSNVISVAIHKGEGDPELGAHVLVL